MSQEQPNNPLHGLTLRVILEQLLERHGWSELGRRIRIRCFLCDPSISSSLAFLRRNDWARSEVESLYLADVRRAERNRKRNAERAERRAHRSREAESTGEATLEAPVKDEPADAES
jgi:uncharacterized protein (DUF2132 family)